MLYGGMKEQSTVPSPMRGRLTRSPAGIITDFYDLGDVSRSSSGEWLSLLVVVPIMVSLCCIPFITSIYVVDGHISQPIPIPVQATPSSAADYPE